jgi:hypothetical protein
MKWLIRVVLRARQTTARGVCTPKGTIIKSPSVIFLSEQNTRAMIVFEALVRRHTCHMGRFVRWIISCSTTKFKMKLRSADDRSTSTVFSTAATPFASSNGKLSQICEAEVTGHAQVNQTIFMSLCHAHAIMFVLFMNSQSISPV